MTGVYAFLRRPKWILSHLFVLVLVVVMIAAGLWQLRRLDERRDRNTSIENRTAEPVADIATLIPEDAGVDIGDDLQYSIASATGEYLADDQVLVRNRTLDGRPGYWVLTPLALGDGTAVVVNRGFIGIQDGDAGAPPPPEGTVSVVGMVEKTRVAEGLQADEPEDGVLAVVGRPDLERIDQQTDADLLPVYLDLEDQVPPVGDDLTLIPRPELDEGPHLSYAVQWFIFTAIALVGYPLVLRRVARAQLGGGRSRDVPDEYL